MPIRALLLTGQSNPYHSWSVTNVALAARLHESGLFDVATEVIAPPTRPDQRASWEISALDRVDVVVLDYEGARWPDAHEAGLEAFVARGGGLVVYHAASNGFPDWPAFQRLCGVGGWGGRDESSGPKVRWRDGRQVLDTSPGVAQHPSRRDFLVTTRASSHPIVRDLPEAWLHADDELYSQLRGPAAGLEVLATGYVDSASDAKATGEHEPVLMAIAYGRGRVFHTTLGHVGPADDDRTTAIACLGFVTTFLRGTEWAATGAVTQPVPERFPTATEVAIA